MTEEIIVWTLLVTLVGLIWVFTCALLTQDRSSPHPRNKDLEGPDGVERRDFSDRRRPS